MSAKIHLTIFSAVLVLAIVVGVSLFDIPVNSDSGFHPTGADNPVLMVFDRPSRSLFVLHEDLNNPRCTITKINPDDFQVIDAWTIDRQIGSFRYYSPENKFYYVSIPEMSLYEFDPVTRQETLSVIVNDYPNNLEISTDGDWIFVCSGEYPKLGPLFSDDPDYWNPRRGVLQKINRASFQIVDSLTTYSGPEWMGIGMNTQRLIVSNSVKNMDRNEMPEGGYEGEELTDLWCNIEVFSTDNMTLVEEIESGGVILSSSDNDLVLAGGSPQYGRLPQLINLQSGTETSLPFPSEGYICSVGLSISANLNKVFMLLDEGGTEFGVQSRVADIQVIDLTNMSSSIYETPIGYAFWQMEVDEVGDQLILFSLSDPGGLVSISPIP